MNKLILPRLISDGMILQREQKCRIWGFDVPGRSIEVSFLGVCYKAVTDDEGEWMISLPELSAGGPYTMTVKDEVGNEITIDNILVGDVWFCSGQSNMELPMARVKDAYPKEVANCTNPAIRTFKIIEHVDFHAPLKDHLTGAWEEAKEDTILAFSATGYFFAKAYYEMTKVPVGFINASLGGSRIECWMGRDMLDGYDEFFALADMYADDEFVESQRKKNDTQALEWNGNLDAKDMGLQEGWQNEDNRWEDSKEVEIPFFFGDTELKDFIGSVWFHKTFYVSEKMADSETKLWLGTIVDSDIVYINGTEVGRTEYQYPPRKYAIEKGLLKAGENTIVIRVKVERGLGRFTPDKTYAIWNEDEKVDLKGTWQYRVGAVCGPSPETDFISWKPTGLYHGMTYPCHKYKIAGVLWYQGESNADRPDSYADLTERMVKGYREKWENEKLPFYFVQLPNFEIDLEDKNSGWPELREAQRQGLAIPYTGMITAMDLGEDNDLHPLNKKDVGYRLALLAANGFGQYEGEYCGPMVENIRAESSLMQTGCRVFLSCSHADEMYAYHPKKGNVIKDFELVDEAGHSYLAEATIAGNQIVICSRTINEPVQVRYCFRNTSRGGLIYNKAGLPMSPFVMTIG